MIHPETRAITIHVSEKVFAGLVEIGRKRGYTPSLFAKLLFEAGYASSVGKGAGDPILADCVERSLSRRAPIAAAPKAVAAAESVRYVVVPVLIPVPIAVPISLEQAPAGPIEAEAEAPRANSRSIRAMAAAGNSPREIARKLGCHEAHVRDVIAGRAA